MLVDYFASNLFGNYYFYNTDVRNSTMSILSDGYTAVKYYEYNEYGKQTTKGNSSFINDMTYTGAVTEGGNVFYMNARFYDANNGRFLTQDTYKGNMYEPWSQNLYTYCGNNPTNFVDPTGHIPFENRMAIEEEWIAYSGNSGGDILLEYAYTSSEAFKYSSFDWLFRSTFFSEGLYNAVKEADTKTYQTLKGQSSGTPGFLKFFGKISSIYDFACNLYSGVKSDNATMRTNYLSSVWTSIIPAVGFKNIVSTYCYSAIEDSGDKELKFLVDHATAHAGMGPDTLVMHPTAGLDTFDTTNEIQAVGNFFSNGWNKMTNSVSNGWSNLTEGASTLYNQLDQSFNDAGWDTEHFTWSLN